MFACMDCGKIFKNEKAAENASINGCPKCGSVDIDIHAETPRKEEDSYEDENAHA